MRVTGTATSSEFGRRPSVSHSSVSRSSHRSLALFANLQENLQVGFVNYNLDEFPSPVSPKVNVSTAPAGASFVRQRSYVSIVVLIERCPSTA